MPAKKSAPKTLLARSAEVAPHTCAQNGRLSAIQTIPGLYDDLARTIAEQRKKPPAQRLGFQQLHALVKECYPAYRGEYAGFWRWVTRHFKYQGQKEQA